MRSIQTLLTATVFSLSLLTGLCVQAKVNKQLPDYQTTQGVSGKLNSIGSDTLANMMTLWQEAFKKLYPNVSTEIQAAGSSTAPTALIEGTANLGPMSRQMKNRLIKIFCDAAGLKDDDDFRAAYAVMGVQRGTKLLGFPVRADLKFGKPQYRSLLPRVKHHLNEDLSHPALAPIHDWFSNNMPEVLS